MSLRALLVAPLAFVLACSSGTAQSSGGDCDAIAESIRNAASQRQPPLNPQGVCNSTDPAVRKDFAKACQALADCQ